MEKTFTSGPASLTLKTDKGVASVIASIDASLGGGQAAGVLKARGSVEIDLDEKQALELSVALIESHEPEALKALTDVIAKKLIALVVPDAAAPAEPSA